MHMLNERLQILISPEQRRRLEAEARRRGASVASVIREAIDARLGSVTREERLRAVEAIESMDGGRFLPPDELDRLVELERDEAGEPRLEGAS
jgi:predicted DNA-binding protein